ncbi:AAA family ATPase [Agarivorans sp. B2Z047]|uniref:ATP-dependent DNA helicase n=1 Tax=Agarivorans sp. B2Z047 TaxID=2652721 RepID=UPI00128D0760|nr:AAA family ATPase [Agarivorans sp. B2Z047]MPW31636.1 AAA family ATPase [Agarivorans sp. B2Z047]UQN42403.1 AAA family ATPase [Agarivorans sp. B2Z047]
MSNSNFLVRITRIYQYHSDNVQLGAVFVNHKAGAHRIILLTTQSQLNIQPRVGQQWMVLKEQNFSVRQQPVSIGGYVDVWRFMQPKLKCVMPDSGAGFVNFLSAEKEFIGIGKVKAQLLWDQFRSGIFSMLETDRNMPYEHDRSITNFEAIKAVLRRDDTVNALYEGFKQYINLKYASQLVEWEIEEPVQRQLFRFADTDALGFLKKNPYRLFSLGMRFSKVDLVAQKHFGIQPEDEKRLVAIIEQSLRLWSDRGHTVADWGDIEPVLRKLLNNDAALIERSKLLTGDIIGFVKQGDKYYVSGNYIFEKTIAKRFKKLSKRQGYWQSELEAAFTNSIPDGWKLEDAQERAVRTALANHVFALSGGAGTGKTTTTKLIVDAYQQLGFRIYPVALSGKAARRLQQSIGIDCMTIARLLREESVSENSVLLIDEASMLDAYTMWRLVTLFSDKTRVMLIGDPYQLPPINAGLILNDVIKSGVINHVELDVVKRQGATSTVPAYSNDIRNGKEPPSLTTSDITFQESGNDMLQDAVTAYSEYDNAMIVASTNATVRAANIKLQDAVNSKGKVLDLTDMPITKGSYELREGDPVVITLTCYKNDVQNGTLGVITNAVATEEYACIIELEDLDEGETNVNWRLIGNCSNTLTLHTH